MSPRRKWSLSQPPQTPLPVSQWSVRATSERPITPQRESFFFNGQEWPWFQSFGRYDALILFGLCSLYVLIRERVKNVCSTYLVSLKTILLKIIKKQLINSFTIHMKNKLEIILWITSFERLEKMSFQTFSFSFWFIFYTWNIYAW